MKKIRKNSSHTAALILLSISGFLGSLPFFKPGLYTAHDIWHQVARLYHYTEAFKAGQLLPSWIATLAQGHGYPLFFFSYHFPWLTALPFTLVGVETQVVLKGLFVGSYILSGLAMYALTTELLKNKLASFTAAILYLFAPYHFLTMYVSAAIGTQYQFMLLPLLFLGATWIVKRKPRVGVVVLATAIAASILSHLMTFVYIFPLVVTYVIFLLWVTPLTPHRRRTVVGLLFFSVFSGILLSSFYLLPSLYFLTYITAGNEGNGFSALYRQNFVTLWQLVYSKWGFGPIISNAKDGEISFQIGIAQWLSIVGSGVAALLWRTKLKRRAPYFVVFFLLIFSLTVFGMTSASENIWKVVTQLITLDYPFRLLLIAVFVASLLAGYFIYLLPSSNWIRLPVAFGLISIAFYTNRNHVRVNLYTDIETSLYVRSEVTTNTFHEYLPTGADSSLLKEENQPLFYLDPPQENTQVSNDTTNASRLHFTVATTNNSIITVRQFDFPGQTVYLNGNVVKHSSDSQGRITLALPAGTNSITVRHEDTSITLISKMLSVFAILLLSKYYLQESKKR